MILNDKGIRMLAEDEGMIEPFVGKQVREVLLGNRSEKVVSYGLSSFGYDIRIGTKFKVFSNAQGYPIIDPKNFDQSALVEVEVGPHEAVIIPPNSYVLGLSMEYFRIPEDVVTICVGKSSYARCGISVNITPFEPSWKGYAVLEVSNMTPLPAKIYAAEGIAQVLFFRGNVPEITYADRKGRYQDQREIVTAKV